MQRHRTEGEGAEFAHHEDPRTVVGNHSGYAHKGSENFEHDDTGGVMNYSGVEDEVFSAYAEHDGWEEGFDY